jgi:hypothetical protein
MNETSNWVSCYYPVPTVGIVYRWWKPSHRIAKFRGRTLFYGHPWERGPFIDLDGSRFA